MFSINFSGFGQSHGTSGDHHSSHPSSHNVPGHSFAVPSQAGAEAIPYPAAPSSQTDYQPSAIVPAIPSSPAPFGVGAVGTGYPAAGTPSPINTPLTGEQPSREYLPSRRTK